MTQQTAEMQVRLQQQELEKKFMQSSLETEILRHQLHQVQEQTTRPVAEVARPMSSYSPAPRNVAPKHKQVQPNSTSYPARKAVPARTYQHIEEEEEEEEEIDDSDFQEPNPRPVRTRSVPASDPIPVSVPKSKKKVSAAPARRNTEENAPLHPIIRNATPAPEEKSKGVTFSREVVTIDSSPVSPDVDKPSHTFPAAPPPPPAKPAKDSSGKDGKTENVGEHFRNRNFKVRINARKKIKC